MGATHSGPSSMSGEDAVKPGSSTAGDLDVSESPGDEIDKIDLSRPARGQPHDSLPSKILTPRSAAAEAEHLRFGHIDYGELEDEEDVKRHYLVRRPRAKQFFFKGKLFRSSEGRGTSRTELLFDLVYVGLIAALAAKACEGAANGAALGQYLITYFAAFLVWDGVREVMNTAWNDDLTQKSMIVWIMICLMAFGNNAPFVSDVPHGGEHGATSTTTGETGATSGTEAVAEAVHRLLRRSEASSSSSGGLVHSDAYEGGERTTTIVIYIVAQASLQLVRLVYSFYIPQYRKQLRLQGIVWIVPLAMYIGAIFTSQRAAIGLVATGLICEYISWHAIYSPTLARWTMHKYYRSAINIEHEVDRHADFYTIVVGEFVYKGFFGGKGIEKATGRSALIMLIAASLQFMYNLSSGCVHYTHPLRFNRHTATAWFVLHIPAVAALTLAGDSGAILIANNTGVPQGLRWYFCGGIATGLASTFGLAIMEVDQDGGMLIMRKHFRLLPRLLSAIIIACLPLADEHRMTSTSVLGITSALCFGTLIWETVTSLHCPHKDPHTGKPINGIPRIFDPAFNESDKAVQPEDEHEPTLPRAA